MELSELEIFLGAIAIAEAIALVILWLKYNGRSKGVFLEPGKDKLRVDYYWIDKDILSKADGNVETILKNLQRTRERAEYIYDVEGTQQLVSKEKSVLVTLKIDAMEDLEPAENVALANAAVDDAEPAEDPTDETDRMGGIKPPVHLRRPPGALMAIEISVVP